MALAKPKFLWALQSVDLGIVENLVYKLRVEVFTAAVSDGVEVLDFPPAGALTEFRNYWMANDDQADSNGSGLLNGVGDLLKILEETLETYAGTGGAVDFDVTLDATARRIDIDLSGGADEFVIFWDNAATTLDKTIWGFTGDTTQSDEAVGANQPFGVWFPDKAFAVDGRPRGIIMGGVSGAVSAASRGSQVADNLEERNVTFRRLPPGKALEEFAPTALPFDTFESLWLNGLGIGRAVRLHDDHLLITPSDYRAYRLDELSQGDPLDRDASYPFRWQAGPIPLIGLGDPDP